MWLQQQSAQKYGCWHYLCCYCCPCLPLWLRSVCCVLFAIIVGLAVTAIVMASHFKMPEVLFNGVVNDPRGLPRFQQASTNSLAFQIHLGLNMSVINPNVAGASFENIKATVSLLVVSRQCTDRSGRHIILLRLSNQSGVASWTTCIFSRLPLRISPFLLQSTMIRRTIQIRK